MRFALHRGEHSGNVNNVVWLKPRRGFDYLSSRVYTSQRVSYSSREFTEKTRLTENQCLNVNDKLFSVRFALPLHVHSPCLGVLFFCLPVRFCAFLCVFGRFNRTVPCTFSLRNDILRKIKLVSMYGEMLRCMGGIVARSKPFESMRTLKTGKALAKKSYVLKRAIGLFTFL